MLKPHDLVVCLYLALNEQPTFAQAADVLRMSASMVHRAVQRATEAKLIDRDRRVLRQNFIELIEHGLRYVFYPEIGGMSRGVATGAAAPGLRERLSVTPENSPVWAHASGRARGPVLIPLHPSAADVALSNPTLHTALAAIDLIRIGTARERAVAGEVIEGLLA